MSTPVVMSARGDRLVDLGELGKIGCRPGLRALEAIESSSETGSIADLANALARRPVLRIIVSTIYETHIDFVAGNKSSAKTYTREEIGAAVMRVGVGKLQEDAFRLLLHAFAPKSETDTDQGNG